MSRLITIQDWPATSEEKIPGGGLGNRLRDTLRMAGAAVRFLHLGLGIIPCGPDGEPPFWRAGYEIEVIKRWGMWNPATFQGTCGATAEFFQRLDMRRHLPNAKTYQFESPGEVQLRHFITNSGRVGGSRKGRRLDSIDQYYAETPKYGCE